MQKDFNFDEFIDFIRWENKRLGEFFNFASPKEEIYAIMTKLMEENGELANEIFVHFKHCRSAKIRENSRELAMEFADNIIVLFLLADKLGIDVTTALADKAEIIRNRK